MKIAGTKKNYEQPEFQLVRQEEQNRVFFTASGEEPVTSGITNMVRNTSTEW